MSREIFEKHGWFEQLYDPKANRVVGLRTITELGERKVGHAGEKLVEISGTIEVNNGHKTERIRFAKPTKLLSTIFPICGRTKAARYSIRDIIEILDAAGHNYARTLTDQERTTVHGYLNGTRTCADYDRIDGYAKMAIRDFCLEEAIAP